LTPLPLIPEGVILESHSAIQAFKWKSIVLFKKYCIVFAKIQHSPNLPVQMRLISLVYSGDAVRIPYSINAQVPKERWISLEKSKRILPFGSTNRDGWSRHRAEKAV